MNKENGHLSKILMILPVLILWLSIMACSYWLFNDSEYECERIRGEWRNSTCYAQNEGDGKFDQERDETEDEMEGVTGFNPAGTYSGETNFIVTLDADIDDSYLSPICSENTIQIVIGKNGAAQGEIRAICSANQDTDNDEMRMTHHSDVTGVIQGEITENSGQISIAYTWRSYLTSPQWETPSLDSTIEFAFPYHVKVNENGMTLIPAADVEDYYSFTLQKE